LAQIFLLIFLSAFISANLRPDFWLWLCHFMHYEPRLKAQDRFIADFFRQMP